jgi:hypothetical protein
VVEVKANGLPKEVRGRFLCPAFFGLLSKLCVAVEIVLELAPPQRQGSREKINRFVTNQVTVKEALFGGLLTHQQGLYSLPKPSFSRLST